TKTKGIKSGAIPNSIPSGNLTKLSNFWGSVHPGGFFLGLVVFLYKKACQLGVD
ncbi:hypothetical protein M2128_001790, partial [Polynucleobacter sphagniphilus]|nr:hypothetical protein [Polynucleobacter sphagniphilus]